jgi:cationic peptide transport system substrate-binding protein
MNILNFIKYTLSITACLYLSGCGEQTKIKLNGLTYCTEGSPSSFNPQTTTSNVTLDATTNPLYDRLLFIDPNTQQFKAGLAIDWVVSPDRLVYRFFLRKDVNFHQTDYFTPTRQFNADDVIFSFARVIDKNNSYHAVSATGYPFFEGIELDQQIQSLTKIDDYTIEFKLARPDSSFIANLASDFSVILSAEYAKTLTERNKQADIDNLPIGTGPFKFKEYRPDNFIRYKRHDQYWSKPASIEQLVFDITPNASSRLAKLLTKECDIMAYPAASQVSVISQNERVNISVETGYNVAYWGFNTEKVPFNNPKIRRALAHAINQETLLQAVYYNTGVGAKSILPPVSWAYNPYLKNYKYNLAYARQLLIEAGYPNGFSMDIMALKSSQVYNPDAVKMAELIQSELAQIGIKVRILKYQRKLMEKKLKQADHDSFLLGWVADNNDPDNFFRSQLSCNAINTGSNYSRWCNSEFDELINQGLTESEYIERVTLYYRAQEIIQQELPLIPLAHSLRIHAYSSDLEGVETTAFGGINFTNTVRQ